MRIILKFGKSNIPVPINNNHIVNSFIHNCLGKNNPFHDAKSDYSISTICGGMLNPTDPSTLVFPDGALVVISAMDSIVITKILDGISNGHNTLGFGLDFKGYNLINEKFINGWNYFNTLTPFLIVKDHHVRGRDKFLKLGDEGFLEQLNSYLKMKLQKISENRKMNLDLSDFAVHVNHHKGNKVKRVTCYANDKPTSINYANMCQLAIHCNTKVAEVLYNIGIGKSTGSGFGLIYKAENFKTYKLSPKKT